LKVIRPHCRETLTHTDCDFIASVLAPEETPSDALRKLLTDAESRDVLLDEEKLFHAILERPACVSISKHLYFYVLVRHVLKEAGIENRLVTDYVAALLAEFSSMQRVREPLSAKKRSMDYLVDMIAALQEADDEERFVLRAHMGNFSLFLSGIFPKQIRRRAERRAAPGLSYYEGVGSLSYREAAHHDLAKKLDLWQPLLILSDAFRTTRLALNELADRLVHLDPMPPQPHRVRE